MVFKYHQNNSGGYLVGDLGNHVFVEAETKELARERLKNEKDYSSEACECCGERWDWEEEIFKTWKEVETDLLELASMSLILYPQQLATVLFNKNERCDYIVVDNKLALRDSK